ncbi:restriction endonuclease subunit S [Bacillus altitudinis]|uniref:restriction endonuclease subunit S n=1 Tax=Bacillus altitudinis TaxID=293387 RepID=UPI001653BD5E|nr:restriction endonuclease subunit S [Bacillus altitudinis]
MPEVRFEGFSREWEVWAVGDIFEIIDGDRGKNYPGESDFLSKGSTLFLDTGNVKKDGFLFNTQKYISKERDVLLRNGKLLLNDFVLTSRGTLGNIAFYNENIAKKYPSVRINSAMLILRSKYKNQISNSFLLSVLRGNVIKKFMKTNYVGSAQPHITKKEFSEVKIYIPKNLKEQEKIGYFFKQLDETIAIQQQELDTLKQTKQGFLQKMFPKEGESIPEIRFPGFSGEWEEVRLGERAIIKGRLGWKSLKQEEYISEGPCMIAGRHIKDGEVQWEQVDHIPQWRYDESPEIMLQNGDIIFSKDGSLGNPALILNLNCLATINSTMMLIRVNKTIEPLFFYQIMRSEKFDRLIYLKVSGSSIPHLFQADMNDFVFLSPIKEEQTQIGNFFKQLDETIALHEQELDILKQTKKAFLQKMFV